MESGESRGDGTWGGDDDGAGSPKEKPGTGRGPGRGDDTVRVDMTCKWFESFKPGRVARTAWKGVRVAVVKSYKLGAWMGWRCVVGY
jgi:hypothetical protein